MLSITFVDCHIYSEHIEQVNRQLKELHMNYLHYKYQF